MKQSLDSPVKLGNHKSDMMILKSIYNNFFCKSLIFVKGSIPIPTILTILRLTFTNSSKQDQRLLSEPLHFPISFHEEMESVNLSLTEFKAVEQKKLNYFFKDGLILSYEL